MSYSKLKRGESVAFKQGMTIALIKPNDLNDLIDMLNDDKVNTYLFFAPADRSLYEGFFGPIIDDTQAAIEQGRWPDSPTFVIRTDEGDYMGMCAVTSVMFHDGNHEVGYQLPVKAWGQGVATQACRLMTEIGFNELGAHKISADCYAGNVGSYKTLEKCGYKQEGRQVDYFKIDQGFDDKLYYGMTLVEYNAR
ncbi:GNAT family protein [Vibrio sp. FNV 38]|nr:GNAT family protein [Vibrio sp. FNV 38]